MANESTHYQTAAPRTTPPETLRASDAVDEVDFFIPPPALIAAAQSCPTTSIDEIWKPAAPVKRKRTPARRWLDRVNVATLITCLIFLYDGREPGWSAMTCMSLVLFSALAIAWVMSSFNWLLGEIKSRRDLIVGAARVAIAPVLAIACGVMIIRALPARIGLWASLDEFQMLMQDAPVETGGKRIDRRVGAYNVRRYAADGKGGVYFVTGEYRDALHGQNVSIGFAFQPSPKSNPFGRGHRLTHIAGQWYTFAATDGGH